MCTINDAIWVLDLVQRTVGISNVSSGSTSEEFMAITCVGCESVLAD